METVARQEPLLRRRRESADLPPVSGDPVLIIEDLWKRYPAMRAPNAAERLLSRLGGVDLSGFSFDMDSPEEGEEEEAQEPAEPIVDRTAATVALSGVSLTATAGTCIGLVGPRDSGKSTLLRIVAGLTPPSAGRVVVAGTVAPALDSLVRLVPARFTVEKTLLAVAALARLSRRAVRQRLPEVFVGPGAAELQRMPAGVVPLARRQELLLSLMLSIDADIVLVDLPLGEHGTRDFLEERVAARRAAGALVIVAAERIEEVEGLADRFVFLSQGTTVAAPAAATAAGAPLEPHTPEPQLTLVGQIGRHGPEPAPGPPRSPDEMQPDTNTTLLLPFLETLVGRDRLALALETARQTAFPTGKAWIPWPHVTNALGLELEAMREVMTRLLDTARGHRERRRVFNEHAAIAGVRLLAGDGLTAGVPVDEHTRLEIDLEASVVDVSVVAKVQLTGNDGHSLSIEQPEAFFVVVPGPHRLLVEIAPGTLRETTYRVTIVVRTSKDGVEGTIVSPRALTFTATAAGHGTAGDPIATKQVAEPKSDVSANWIVER